MPGEKQTDIQKTGVKRPCYSAVYITGIFYSESLINRFTRSSTIRRYVLFILSFRKLLPTSFVVSSGTCIYLSSTRLIRASASPICVPNRSKSKRHGCPVLSYTSLFSMSGDKPPSSPKSSPFICRLVFNKSYAGARR